MCSSGNTSHCTSASLSLDEPWKTEGVKTNRFYSSRPSLVKTGPRKKLESVYSCDSVIEGINEQYEDDSDPYDARTRAYLDEHVEEIGLQGKDAFQLYADSKVAEVLARGTLDEKKEKKRLDKLKTTLPSRRIVTPDFTEARNLIEEIDTVLEKRKDWETVKDAFESIKAMIKDEFNQETIKFSGQGRGDVVEVRQLAIELFKIMCVDEEEDDKIDEWIEFKQFLDNGYRSNDRPLKREPDMSGAQNPSGTATQLGSDKLLIEERKCPKYPDSEDETISIMKMIIMFKKRIHQVLCGHVDMMKSNKHMMKMKLFRIWNKNQEEGLAEMAADIIKREQDLRLTLKRTVKTHRTRKKVRDTKQSESKGKTIAENPGGRYRYKRTLECMRKRDKLLTERDNSFLSGVLNGETVTKGTLEKVWPNMPQKPGIPPAPPSCNRRAIAILNKCKESKKRILTYGNLLRLLEQDDSFILEDAKIGSTTNDGTTTGSKEITEKCWTREKSVLLKDDPDVGCPLVTNDEFELYMKELNHRFFPDPNFKLIQDALTFDENAFMTERPDPLCLNYSLEELEFDTYQALGHSGPQARAVYFFRYRTKFAAVDVQDAYERYVYENNAMDMKAESHPYGCLLLYSNVALGIVMIEGDSLHVFNHFAGFKHCPIMRMIKTGRILYVRERVSQRLFRQWVSMIASPPPGVITYLTKTKKMLHRVAEPRAHHFKVKLERFYRIMSKKKLDENYYDVGERGLFMAPNPVLMLETCVCCLKDGEKHKQELHVPAFDLLPSPALVTYLLRYKKLKSINRFLNELFMQPELESEDETYHVMEDSILGKYFDSVDEEERPKFAKRDKKICKEREILSILRRDLIDNTVKDNAGMQDPAWVKLYDIDQFSPQLAEVKVKNVQETQQVIKVHDLIDSEDSSQEDGEKNFLKIFYDTDKWAAQRKLMAYHQTGSENWQKNVKRFGLSGREIKRMMEDARKFKKLRQLMIMEEKLKKRHTEEAGESGSSDMEEPGAKVEVKLEDEVTIKAEVEDGEGEEGECAGEQGPWPVFSGWSLMGEEPELFGEWRFKEPPGELFWHEWNGEMRGSEAALPFSPEGLKAPSARLSSEKATEDGSAVGESTVEGVEDDDVLPGAPPASSVTDSSTDP